MTPAERIVQAEQFMIELLQAEADSELLMLHADGSVKVPLTPDTKYRLLQQLVTHIVREHAAVMAGSGEGA